MLPDPALRAVYGKATWLYVYRDFSGSESDRRAERVLLRLGVSSWPQHFLVDPTTWETLADTGRSKESFLRAFEQARVAGRGAPDAHRRLRDAEARAIALEEGGSVALAQKGIDDEDIVVRNRALAILAKRDVKSIAKRALRLLEVENDPFRYEVCRILKEQADPDSASALCGIVREPKGSRNPNVLRIRAVEALGTCGTADSVEAIAPFAASGEYFNGLTGISIDALVAIAARHPKTKGAVRATLKRGYPVPPADGEARAMAACTALARKIHAALGEKGAFPDPYDGRAREKLMR